MALYKCIIIIIITFNSLTFYVNETLSGELVNMTCNVISIFYVMFLWLLLLSAVNRAACQPNSLKPVCATRYRRDYHLPGTSWVATSLRVGFVWYDWFYTSGSTIMHFIMLWWICEFFWIIKMADNCQSVRKNVTLSNERALECTEMCILRPKN